MNQKASNFLDLEDSVQYIGQETLHLLQTLKQRAKDSHLTSKHLYKDFKGLYFQGNLELLLKPKIAIIGTRSPNQYTKQITTHLTNTLVQNGFIIVSGGAIGIDCIAHTNSQEKSILILPCGINTIYPKENKNLIEYLKTNALTLSEYADKEKPFKHSFLERNRIIIALSDIIIIPQADLKSGSSSSANLAIFLKKELYVLPHRLNESLGTQALLEKQEAQGIYNIESFTHNLVQKFNLKKTNTINDPLLNFASNHGLLEDALAKFGNKVFEYELEGKIKRNGLYIEPC